MRGHWSIQPLGIHLRLGLGLFLDTVPSTLWFAFTDLRLLCPWWTWADAPESPACAVSSVVSSASSEGRSGGANREPVKTGLGLTWISLLDFCLKLLLILLFCCSKKCFWSGLDPNSLFYIYKNFDLPWTCYSLLLMHSDLSDFVSSLGKTNASLRSTNSNQRLTKEIQECCGTSPRVVS